MTIEFHCPVCQKVLKTADDRAGVRANCPGCGNSVTVPMPDDTSVQSEPDRASRAVVNSIEVVPGSSRSEATPEETTPLPGDSRPCPMCGAEIKQSAKRCRFCGENILDRENDTEQGRIEAGDILTRSWESYQRNLWILVGSTLVMIGIALVLIIAGCVGMVFALSLVTGDGPGQQGPDATAIVAIVAISVLLLGLLFAIQAFLQGGYNILMLRIARGEQAEISDLFSASPYFWRLFLGNMLFALMSYAGMAACIVPGVFVFLIFWPFSFVIVAQDTGVIESFRKSKELTDGNLAAVFLLFLAAMGFNMLGEMACYVGMIFSIPLGALLFAMAYCRMNGESPPRSRRVSTAS